MDEMATDGHEVVNEEEEDDLCDLTIGKPHLSLSPIHGFVC